MIRRPRRSTRMTHSFPTRRSADLHDLRAGARKLRHLGDAGCGSEVGHRRGDAQPRCDRADARQFPARARTGAAQAMMGSSASESAYRVLMGVLESRTGQTLSPSRIWRIEMLLKPVMQRHGIDDLDALVAALVTSHRQQLLDDTDRKSVV